MDKTQSSAGSSRTRAPKPRNSEVRKEQNRIASRAYREKRKQKLALLDQILHTESQENSSSASEADDSHSLLPVIPSRQASMSPAPTPEPSSWTSNGHLVPSINQFGGGETFDDLWMSGFDRSNDMFGGSNDFDQTFHPADVAARSTGTPGPYMSTITSMSQLSTMPSVPLDPMLSENHLPSYQTHPVHAESGSSQRNSMYDGNSMGYDQEAPLMVALESFAKLSAPQQAELLAVINRRKGPSPSGHDRSWDMRSEYQSSGKVVPAGPGALQNKRYRVAALPDPKANHLQLTQTNFWAAISANARAVGMLPDRLAFADAISRFNIFASPDGDPVNQGLSRQSRFTNITKDLRPIDSQFRILHHPYLDVLPFVEFREKVLAEIDGESPDLNEEELCHDLLHDAIICWGSEGNNQGMGASVPWDIRSWEPQLWFLQKYASLVGGYDGEMWRSCTWWHAMRNEKIELPPPRFRETI